MTVNQFRKQIFPVLADQFAVVSRPDHPFLLFGPDMLVGSAGSAHGLFFLHSVEARRLDDLLSRVALSRLAYPSTFSAVLILRPGDPTGLDSSLDRHFDRIMRWENDRTKLVRTLGDLQNPDIQIPDDARTAAFARAQIYYSESIEQEFSHGSVNFNLKLQRLALQDSNLMETKRPWAYLVKQRTRRTRSPHKLWHSMRVATANLEANDDIYPLLTRTGQLFFNLDFTLSNGVPYPKNSGRPNALLVNKLPIHRSDPTKWLRGAAFSGYAIIDLADDNVEEKLHQIEKRIEQSR